MMLKKLLAMLMIQAAVLTGLSGQTTASDITVQKSAIGDNSQIVTDVTAYNFVNKDAWLFKNEEYGIELEIPKGFERRKDFETGNTVFGAAYSSNAAALTIDVSDYNKKWLISEKDLEDFRKSILKVNKPGKISGKYIVVSSEIVNVGKERATHTVFGAIYGKEKKELFVKEEYFFVTPTKIYVVSYTVPQIFWNQYQEKIPKFMATIKFTEILRNVKLGDTSYSYAVPSSFIDSDPKIIAPDHIYISGNETIMAGVMVKKIKDNPKYAYFPASLSNLSIEEQKKLDEEIKNQLKNEMGSTIRNIQNKFIKINGMDCVLSEFDDVTSHSMSYIFIKDGNYIAFDYIYPAEDADTALPLIQKSAASIKLE